MILNDAGSCLYRDRNGLIAKVQMPVWPSDSSAEAYKSLAWQERLPQSQHSNMPQGPMLLSASELDLFSAVNSFTVASSSS